MSTPFATGPLAQAIGWALLHLVWQAAAVAGLLGAALATIPARQAHLRYAAACAALLLVVILGAVTGVRSYPGADAAPVETTLAAWPLASLGADAGSATGHPALASAWARAAHAALPSIVTLWLLGVALCSARMIGAWIRVQRLASRAVRPARAPWPDVARRLGRALGVRGAVRVLESAVADVPCVVGFVRPAILLPASSLSGLTPAQLEMILAHELAHVRRHDVVVNYLQIVVETLLFYHPAVWWISRQVRQERESCCDDLAVTTCGDALRYAQALTQLAELRLATLRLAASGHGGSLLDRIGRLVGDSTRCNAPAARGAAALALLAGALLGLAAPSLSAMGRTPVPAAAVLPGTIVPAVIAMPAPSVAALAIAGSDGPVAATTDDLDAEAATEVEVAAESESELEVEAESSPASDFASEGDERLTLDERIELGPHQVSAERVRELRGLFPQITIREIAGMSAVGATPALVRALRRAGLAVETAHEAQGLAALGVTPEYVRAMRAAGLAVATAEAASGLRAVGVTPEYVAAMRRAGFAVESAHAAQGLRAVGVTPEMVRGLRAVGLAVESAEEAQGLAALGVTPEFVREMRDAGLAVEAARDAQGLRAVGVTGALVRGLRAAGIDVASAHEAQGLAALGVTPEYVRELRRAGVDVRGAGDAQSLRALNVSPELVRRLARAGYRGLSVEQLTRLAAGGLNDDFIREMSRYRDSQ